MLLPRGLPCLLLAAALAAPAGAATFTVDSSVDAQDALFGNGICATAAGQCTLRAALQEATTNAAASDEIQIGVRTIRLSPALGPLSASGNASGTMSILGAGARETVIIGASPGRVFSIGGPGTVTIADLTIRGGRTSGNGGGIELLGGSLTCTRCFILDNRASFGGGVHANDGTTLVLDQSVVAGNRTTTGGGGGLRVGGAATLTDTLVTQNRALASGGGISSLPGSNVSLTRSTVSLNLATAGAGIAAGDDMSVANSTITGNVASIEGGGLAGGTNVTVELDRVTLVENQAQAVGGAIAMSGGTVVTLSNSIVANNTAPACDGDVTSQDYNLIETPGVFCSIGGNTTNNITGQDPNLLPLGSYGGPTPTHEMSNATSPALDAADPASCSGTDQRGFPRPQGAACDIGATEMGGLIAVQLELDTAGNQVLETDEVVVVEPFLKNIRALNFHLVNAGLGPLSGPPTGGQFDYLVPDGAGSYGAMPSGGVRSCDNVPNCYSVHVDSAVAQPVRPLRHWDVIAPEELTSNPLVTDWRIHVGESFPDVPRSDLDHYRSTEAILHHGVTNGCSDTAFCPTDAVSRREISFLLLRARHGEFFAPADCAAGSELFADVPATDPACPWIEQLVSDGLASGCDATHFCPDQPVTRARAARLLLASKGESPTVCFENFDDVSAQDCPWLEEIVFDDIALPCATSPDRFCPTQPLTRRMLAGWLARGFGLDVWSF